MFVSSVFDDNDETKNTLMVPLSLEPDKVKVYIKVWIRVSKPVSNASRFYLSDCKPCNSTQIMHAIPRSVIPFGKNP